MTEEKQSWQKFDRQARMKVFLECLEVPSLKYRVGSRGWSKEMEHVLNNILDVVEMELQGQHLEEVIELNKEVVEMNRKALEYGQALQKLSDQGISLENSGLK